MACEEMARAAGDCPFAEESRRLFASGSKWIDANLFNGEYYIQRIRGIPVEKSAEPLQSRGGAEDPKHPDFQLGEGCLADQLIYAGMVREGVQCFENVRRRYDGERRNPRNEPECGHQYARAMPASSGILALSGLRYHGVEKSVAAAPKFSPASFRSFWPTATEWGTFSQSIERGRCGARRGGLPLFSPSRSIL